MLYVRYPKKQGDWDMIHEENDVIEMQEELVNVKMGQAHLYGNENRVSKSL